MNAYESPIFKDGMFRVYVTTAGKRRYHEFTTAQAAWDYFYSVALY